MTSFFSDPDWWGSSGWDSLGPAGTAPVDNPFADFLEEEPELPYQAALKKANLTPNQYQTFRNQRQNIFAQFQARLGEQLLQGTLPTERWTDFTGNFDWNKEFERFAPSQRLGGGTGNFGPTMRFGQRG